MMRIERHCHGCTNRLTGGAHSPPNHRFRLYAGINTSSICDKLSQRTLREVLHSDHIERKAEHASYANTGSHIVGMGGVALDYLATVDDYPSEDDKIRTTNFKTEGGGNCGNSMTAISRLLAARPGTHGGELPFQNGLDKHNKKVVIISKVGNDSVADSIIKELEQEGMDCSNMMRGNCTSPFTYIIVSHKSKTRTCIHTPMAEGMTLDEISKCNLEQLLRSACLVYLDGRHTEAAILLAKAARREGVPVLVDAEKPRPHLEELLSYADIVVASEGYPLKHMKIKNDLDNTKNVLGKAMLYFAQDLLHNAKLFIVTRGERGSVVLSRGHSENFVKDLNASDMDEVDERILQHDSLIMDRKQAIQTTNSHSDIESPVVVDVGTNALICPSAHVSVVDTTGAGDAFIGGICYAIALAMDASLGQVLPFASLVAAEKCTVLGARSGLPYGNDLSHEILQK